MNAFQSPKDTLKEYIYDMLAELACLARSCNESRTALILEALVSTADFGDRLSQSNAELSPRKYPDELGN